MDTCNFQLKWFQEKIYTIHQSDGFYVSGYPIYIMAVDSVKLKGWRANVQLYQNGMQEA